MRLRLLLALVSVLPLLGAAPAARLTPDQEQLLARQKQLIARHNALADADKPDEAGPVLEQALAIERQVHRLPRWFWAASMRARLAALSGAGRHADAITWATELVEMARLRYGEGDWRVRDEERELADTRLRAGWTAKQRQQAEKLDAAVESAQQLYDRGKYREALQGMREIVHLRRTLFGEQHPTVGSDLGSLAAIHRALGQAALALPVQQQAVRIVRETSGVRHPGYANQLLNLAATQRALGANSKARDLLEEARGIYRDLLGERDPRHVQCLNNLAMVLLERGDFATALPMARDVVRLRKELLGADHPAYATSLNNLGVVYQALGEYQKALPLHEQALAIRKKKLGPRHPLVATMLTTLGHLHRARGEYPRARSWYEQSLELLRATHGTDHPDYAEALGNLAAICWDTGDSAGALALHLESLQRLRRALGPNHPEVAQALSNAGIAYKELGQLPEARRLLNEAVRIYAEELADRHPAQVEALGNLAAVYRAEKDYPPALVLSERALALARTPSQRARCLLNVGLLHRHMGDLTRALRYYHQALALLRPLYGDQHPRVAGVYYNLALVHDLLGDEHRALTLAWRTLQMTRRNLDLTAMAQSERQHLAAVADHRHHLDALLYMTRGKPAETARVYDEVLAWKGVVFSRQVQRRLLVDDPDPESRALLAQLRNLDQQMAALVFATGDRSGSKRLAELTREKEALEVELARRSERFRELRRPFTARDLALPTDAVLVDFLIHVHNDRATGKKEYHLAAFVVRPGKSPVRLDLGPTRPIAEAILAWRKAIRAGADDSINPPRLRKLVWEPLEPHLAGAATVLISPDGNVAALPFAALPGRVPGTFLLEERAIAMVPVPRLVSMPASPARRTSLLVVGGVTFGERAGKDRPVRNWASLPGSAVEADRVAAVFTATHPGGGVLQLLQDRASKPQLLDALPRQRFVHLATHGFFAPARVRQALASQEHPQGRSASWNPLLLSGLVFAGANQPDSGSDNGILTAREISELDLRGCELAVLSACETGLGEVAGGEGLLGLQRAFAVAGVHSLVSSLWNVNDPATSVLMEEFYDNLWRKKRSRLEALRQAQLTVLRNPDRVRKRSLELATLLARQGVGKRERQERGIEEDASDLVPARAERSPVTWWAAFTLSGGWR